jgi:hypothetical protein
MMLVRSFMGRGARICCVGVVELGMRRPTLCSKNLLLLLLLLLLLPPLLSNFMNDPRKLISGPRLLLHVLHVRSSRLISDNCLWQYLAIDRPYIAENHIPSSPAFLPFLLPQRPRSDNGDNTYQKESPLPLSYSTVSNCCYCVIFIVHLSCQRRLLDLRIDLSWIWGEVKRFI